jgi:hypothetical protein
MYAVHMMHTPVALNADAGAGMYPDRTINISNIHPIKTYFVSYYTHMGAKPTSHRHAELHSDANPSNPGSAKER